jgi:GntR family transcriptional regulator, transcriptional repressor for pyruvate dehydrogenase complex
LIASAYYPQAAMHAIHPIVGLEGQFMTLFTPVTGEKVSEEIVQQIEVAIDSGHLQPGHGLPSERELQTRFEASRGAIREAMRILRQKGLIETRKGAQGGHYIKEVEIGQASEHLALMVRQKQLPLSKLLQFRYGIDQAILCLAVKEATKAECRRMSALAERLLNLCQADTPDMAAISRADRDINLCLVEMTHNPFYEWVMRTIQLSFGSYDHVLYEDPHTRREVGINWHHTAKALIKGDIQKAMQWFGHWYVLLERRLLECFGEEVFNNGGGPMAPYGETTLDDPDGLTGAKTAPESGGTTINDEF